MGDAVTPQQILDAPPANGMEGLPDDFTFVSAGESPVAAMAALAKGLDGSSDDSEVPLAEVPPDDQVTLPGGYLDPETQTLVKVCTVRELTGEDEEYLARAMAARDFSRYVQVMLERATVLIGSSPATAKILDSLCLGDRDMLVLGIRLVTYGDTIDTDVQCMHCGVESKIRIDLRNEVKITQAPFDLTKQPVEVALRKGHVARIRLTNGADQREVIGQTNKTVAELNTDLLARLVESIDGVPVRGSVEPIRKLSMADRDTLITWLRDNQPGPELDSIKHECEVCRKETPIGLTTGDLFRW